jgi:IS5 family transposase
MEEALHDVPLYCEFAKLDAGINRLPDESTILRFCRLLQAHNLSAQLLATINATLIAAPNSTKNDKGERDPQMHQTKRFNTSTLRWTGKLP